MWDSREFVILCPFRKKENGCSGHEYSAEPKRSRSKQVVWRLFMEKDDFERVGSLTRLEQ